MQISRQMLGGSQRAIGPSVTSCSNSFTSKTTPGSLSERRDTFLFFSQHILCFWSFVREVKFTLFQLKKCRAIKRYFSFYSNRN